MQVKRNEVGSYTPIYLLSIIVFFVNAISSVVFLISNVSASSIITTIIKVVIDISAIVVFIRALINSKSKGIKNGVYLTLFYTVSLITFFINSIISLSQNVPSDEGSIIGSITTLIFEVILYIPPIIFVSAYFKRPSKANKVLSIISVIIYILLNIGDLIAVGVFITGNSNLKITLLSSIVVSLLSIAISILVCNVIIKAYSINEVNYATSGSTEDRSAIDEVQFLKSQLDNGVITQEEFNIKKKELLNL